MFLFFNMTFPQGWVYLVWLKYQIHWLFLKCCKFQNVLKMCAVTDKQIWSDYTRMSLKKKVILKSVEQGIEQYSGRQKQTCYVKFSALSKRLKLPEIWHWLMGKNAETRSLQLCLLREPSINTWTARFITISSIEQLM